MFIAHGRLRHDALVDLLRNLRSLTTERLDRDRAVKAILAAVCGYAGWELGHAYGFDDSSGELRATGWWHGAGTGVRAPLVHASEGTSLAPGQGLPGRAFRSRRPEWTMDPTLEGGFVRAAAVRASGLRAAIAVPVLVRGSVDTVLEFFHTESQPPDEDMLSVLEFVAATCGRSLEVERLEREMRAERSAAEEELRLHGSAAAHVRDAIVVSTVGKVGGAPTILYVNAAFTRMTGYSEAEVLGRSFGILAGPKTSREAIRIMHEQFRRGQDAVTELIAYRKDGVEFLLNWHATPIAEADGTVRHIASIQRDITEERKVEQALRRVDRDALTGLPTREVLEHRLQLSIARAGERPDHRFALLFLDLDGFKAVNDEHGHVVGDQLLTSAARRLEGTIRPGDALARFGGDEFVILLQHADLSSVTMVAERVQDRMSAPFEIQGNQLDMAVSIGVALSGPDYRRPEEVIRDADAAMYEAKRKGKGRIEFFGRLPAPSSPALRIQ